MVRATIADPNLVNKTREGRVSEVRPLHRLQSGVHRQSARRKTPALAARSIRRSGTRRCEARKVSLPAKEIRRVLVVGGGPAGMEAARIAAMRGHEVVLCEADKDLGRQVAARQKGPLPRCNRRCCDLARVRTVQARRADQAQHFCRYGRHRGVFAGYGNCCHRRNAAPRRLSSLGIRAGRLRRETGTR